MSAAAESAATRMPLALTVLCPKCFSAPGYMCIRLDRLGAWRARPHPERSEAARRKSARPSVRVSDRVCETCGKRLVRHRHPSGALESDRKFMVRRHCDRWCARRKAVPNQILPEKRDEIARLLSTTVMSTRRIAATVGVSKNTVQAVKGALGLRKASSRRIEWRKITEVESPTLCECGCGHRVNPLYDQVRELRRQRKTFKEIGALLAVDERYARVLHRKPPSFVRGHSARAARWRTERCRACGRHFRTSAQRKSYCGRRDCRGSRLHGAASREHIRNLDRRNAAEVRRYRRTARLERRWWESEAERDAREHEREQRRVAIEVERLSDDLRSLHDQVDGELAALIREQATDDALGHYAQTAGMVSLDARTGEDGGSFHDILRVRR